MVAKLQTLAAIALAALTTGAAARPLALKGAVIGMTIGEWRALDPPAGEGANAAPNCWTLDRAGRIAGRPMTATDQATHLVVCAYDARYGETWSSHSFYLDPQVPTLRAYGVRYIFTNGRLSEIDYRASAEARAQVESLIGRQCGAPARVVSHGARLVEVWRAPDGEVTLTDPSADPVELSVRMAGPSAPSPELLRSAFAEPGGG